MTTLPTRNCPHKQTDGRQGIQPPKANKYQLPDLPTDKIIAVKVNLYLHEEVTR
jgi:hypothetical protein